MDPRIKQVAREEVRNTLARVKGFKELSEPEQLSLYKELVDARATELSLQQSRGNGDGVVARQMGPFGLPDMPGSSGGVKRASDNIDYDKLQNKRIDQAGELAGDFMQQVNFPAFVRDLLKGVFDANLEVTVKQMQQYVELMKAATASISKFVKAIDDTASFGYLVENNDEFGLGFDEDDKDEEGQPRAVLLDKDGNQVATAGKEPDDSAIKMKIMDAKIAMAKEQRALLRETILMGVTRLVVERGTVKASVVFDIKAKEKITTQQKAANSKKQSSSQGITASGGLFGSIFGGPSGGMSNSERNTQISIASAKSVGSTELAAKVMGSVEIVFKSDYFKLDNFAEMYGPVGAAPGGAPAAPGAAPKLPLPPAPGK